MATRRNRSNRLQHRKVKDAEGRAGHGFGRLSASERPLKTSRMKTRMKPRKIKRRRKS